MSQKRLALRPFLTASFAVSALVPVPAMAQAAVPGDVARQLEAMQAEIARLSAEVAELKAERAAREAPAAAASQAPAAPQEAPSPALATAWKGAPEQSSEDGFSFKPRGRLQIDTGVIDAPVEIRGLGRATEFRRAYLGLEGSLPGNFGYRIEADFANSEVDLTDVYLTYEASEALTMTLGNHKPFGGLDEMTSDLFTPLMERAAFTSAFGFERRVGLSGAYGAGDLLIQAGVFADDPDSLNDDGNNSYSLDGRIAFSPAVGGGRLHIGGSAHYRDINDGADVVRYRARPFLHVTDVRLVDTGQFSASGERNFGAELAYIRGPFHATAEAHVLTALRPGLDNPTFWGGYVEAGVVVTGGDRTAYKGGAYDRIKPVSPVTEGGIGAIQLNARYDRIDLSDGPIVGGVQQTLGLSAIWMPTDYVRFLVNYGHIWIGDAAVPAELRPDYQVDAFGMRAQVDF
jgi:phosphate-selective porin OprO/OprP